MRLSFDRLAGLAKEQVGYDARSGALFVFFGRRRDALKVLFFDGTGMCIFYKRLDRGAFRIPKATSPTACHVEVDDATSHPQVKDNPLVVRDGFRSYLGAPLVSSRGHVLGTVCVLDVKPRRADPELLESLRFLAQQVMTTLERRHLDGDAPAASDP